MLAEDYKHALSQRCIFWVISDVSTGVPKIALCKQSKWPDLDVVYILDLQIAKDRGLKFYQTGRFAIVLCNTMLTEVLVKVVKLNRNISEREILSEKRPPQFTEVTRMKRQYALICGTSIGKSVVWWWWKRSKLSYRPTNSSTTPTVARQRGPGIDLSVTVFCQMMTELFRKSDEKRYQKAKSKFIEWSWSWTQCRACYHNEKRGHRCCIGGPANPGASGERNCKTRHELFF